MRLVWLLLLAATLAAATRDFGAESGPGRELLQSSTDCNRSVNHCTTCRYQFYRGTVTKAICTKCETGYVVKASGRACYCAPGYYTQNDTTVTGAVGFACDKCATGYYCPGAKITADSSKARWKCGNYKITTTEYGKSERECVVLPGYGWGTAETSAACEQGYYNPGYNTRKCTKCPGSLTTLGTNSNSSQDCQAGIGSYYLRGKAVACARGTYKEYIGNNDCDECPTGTTTVEAGSGATHKLNCTKLLPGYAIVSANIGVTNATECPQDWYRKNETDLTAGVNVPCIQCGLNLVTLPNVTKATTPDACLAPPGYGWTAGGDDGQGNATKCGYGFYNPGYNREPCVKCGNGTITTDSEYSTSADDCYTPAGDGNRRDPVSGVLEGYNCPNNTYGRPNNTYGLVDVECTKCLDHTHTVDTNRTGAESCLTDAGYGWDNGQVNQCDYASYNPGENQQPCTKCGDGYNTSTVDNATEGYLGAWASSQCRFDFGYQNGTSNQIEPCLRGWYKDVIGIATCTRCPSGTSTTITMAAVNKTDCDVCIPGYGSDGVDNKINVTDITSNITCSVCGSGTYSSGYVQGGQKCESCPKTQNFTGAMVSRLGTWTPEDCYGQFITDPANEQNFLTWDYITMTEGGNYQLKSSGYDTINACQTGCGGEPSCQYFAFYKTGGPNGTGDGNCFWRIGDPIENVYPRTSLVDNWNAPTHPIVLFEIKEGAYVTYPLGTGETVGAELALTGAAVDSDFKSMRTACDRTAACVGLYHQGGGSNRWKAFAGSLREDVIAKVRVVGRAINAWVDEPNGQENNEGWTY